MRRGSVSYVLHRDGLGYASPVLLERCHIVPKFFQRHPDHRLYILQDTTNSPSSTSSYQPLNQGSRGGLFWLCLSVYCLGELAELRWLVDLHLRYHIAYI